MTDEQKRLRKSIIEENRKRKSRSVKSSCGDFNDVSSNSSNDSIPCYEAKPSKLTEANINNNGITANLIIFEEKRSENKEEMSVIAIQRPISDPKHVFNEMEGNRLTELFNAMQYMIDPSVPFIHPVNDFWEAIHTLYIKLDIDTRKLVKTSKNLKGFTNIDQNDQITLLKFASIEISLIRMLLNFDFQLEHWNIPTVCYLAYIYIIELLINHVFN